MLSDKMLVTSYTLTNVRNGRLLGLLRSNGDKWTLYNANGQPVCDLSQQQVECLYSVNSVSIDNPLPWEDADLETRGYKLGIPTV